MKKFVSAAALVLMLAASFGTAVYAEDTAKTVDGSAAVTEQAKAKPRRHSKTDGERTERPEKQRPENAEGRKKPAGDDAQKADASENGKPARPRKGIKQGTEKTSKQKNKVSSDNAAV